MISLVNGNALQIPLADRSVQMCVTSPPYWGLRDYGIGDQLGLEPTPDEYVANMVQVFREVWRVLRDDGTVWLNLGDSYNGSASQGGYSEKQASNRGAWHNRKRESAPNLKPKDIVGIPWRVAFALQADGWYLRSDIIWHKPNPMPESVTDRPTKSHEYMFLLSKNKRYYYDADAVREAHKHDGRSITVVKGRGGSIQHRNGERWPGAGRNRRTVWTIATQPYKGAHFATFPEALVEPCIKAGSYPGTVVLDPFAGSGTTGIVARRLGRSFVGLDLSFAYLSEQARSRLELDRLAERQESIEVEPAWMDTPLFSGMNGADDHG